MIGLGVLALLHFNIGFEVSQNKPIPIWKNTLLILVSPFKIT
jgi:hypothetical protein